MTTLQKLLAAAGLSEQQIGKVKTSRTGGIYSIAGSQFLIEYPDGSSEKVWSPPWHTMTPEAEQLGATLSGLKKFEGYRMDCICYEMGSVYYELGFPS